MRKYKTLIVILLIAVSLSFSACEKEPEIDDVQSSIDLVLSDEEFDNLEEYEAEDQPSESEGAELEENLENQDEPAGDKNSAEVINSDSVSAAPKAQEEKRTFAPHETGSDPNPNSDFAKLANEDKVVLVDWLSQISDSYQKIGDSFNNFISANVNSDKLKSEQNIGELESFQDLKNEVSTALTEIDQAGANLNAPSAQALKEKASSMNQWYKDFLSKLENMKLSDPNLQAELDNNLNEAMSTMQGFLDELYSFSN